MKRKVRNPEATPLNSDDVFFKLLFFINVSFVVKKAGVFAAELILKGISGALVGILIYFEIRIKFKTEKCKKKIV